MVILYDFLKNIFWQLNRKIFGPTLGVLIPSKFEESIRGTNTSYQRFVIVSQAQSGTTMLASALSSHPNVSLAPEIFNGKRFVYPQIKGKRILLDYHPTKFLELFYFSGYKPNVKAVGFKLFPSQINNQRFNRVWDWLKKQGEIKMIVLLRKNMLASFVSAKISKLTGKWNITQDSDRPKLTLHVQAEELIQYFRIRTLEIEQIYSHFTKNEMKTVNYEELVLDFEAGILEIQDFLGLEKNILLPQVIKKENRKMSEIIENYDEIIKLLEDTQWSYLLEMND